MKKNRLGPSALAVKLICLGLIAVTAFAKHRLRVAGLTASAESTVARPGGPVASTVPAPRVSVSEEGQAELVKLTTKGFEPAEITRPAGKFLLGVTNRTGLAALSLRLTHESRRQVDGKQLGREMGWHRVLDLPAGHYRLSEASHPDWVCRITITAR